MLVRVNDLQVDESGGMLVHCIGHHQPDTSGLWVLIRGRVTSPPAHPLLITPTSQINVMLFCCFSEISVDELTVLRNLFLLLTHNEKHHAIKMEIRILMHVSPWVVVLLSSLYDLISLCFHPSFTHFIISLSFSSVSDKHWPVGTCWSALPLLNPFRSSIHVDLCEKHSSWQQSTHLANMHTHTYTKTHLISLCHCHSWEVRARSWRSEGREEEEGVKNQVGKQ